MLPATAGLQSRFPAFTKVVRRETKGRRYPADPPTVEEIIAVMGEAGDSADGMRLRALIVILWRAAYRSARRWISPRVGALSCVIRGVTAGRQWESSSARTAAKAGVRRRFAPHQLRHAHAVEMAHEGVPLVVIQRQLGHAKPQRHLDPPAGNRQLGDHPDSSLAAGPGDPGHSRPADDAL